MEETRIDRLEVRFDELAAEMRDGHREVDARLCKIESRLSLVKARLEQCATKSEIADLRNDMYRMNAELKAWMLATALTIIASSLAIQHWNG